MFTVTVKINDVKQLSLSKKFRGSESAVNYHNEMLEKGYQVEFAMPSIK